jgi:hypothetical protein
MDPVTHGSLNWTVEIHSRSSGSGRIKTQTSLFPGILPGVIDLMTRGPPEIDDWDPFVAPGFRLLNSQNLLAPSKSVGVRDQTTRGSWIWTVEIHSGSSDSGKIKSQTYFSFCVFTRSYGSDNTWLLLINDSDSLRVFDHFGTSTTSGLCLFDKQYLTIFWTPDSCKPLKWYS